MLCPQPYVIHFIFATVLLPVLSIPFLYVVSKKANPAWIVSAISLLQIGLCIYIFIAVYQGTTFHKSWLWFVLSKGLSIQIGIYVDLLSALLLLMVGLISWVVALYSLTYLPAHTNLKRYFSLYSLSLTTMLWLLVADNLWGILLGWELLSISSCLLIGFWHQSPAAMQASTYAWAMSKLGSICFLVGILLIVVELGNCDLSTLSAAEPYLASHLSNKLSMAGCCLLIAAFTKTTQFPFFSWLPYAMVAPTPVSALLHTATVLSAGVYLLIRIQPILHVELNTLLIIIGYLTALMGASAALAQQHFKRMLAYSTLSHLGYVVAAIGLGNAPTGIIYLVVHAFAKACLFLIAGVIARFLQTNGVAKKEAYTMAYMGGMLHRLPLVAISYLMAAWGLGVLPGLIGFRVKESILAQTFVWGSQVPREHLGYIIPLLALISNALTILYMGQAFVRIFLGKRRWEISPSALSTPCLMQGSMVACTISILFISHLLNNFLILVTVSSEGAWQSISSVDIDKTIKVISYGLLLLVILWLVMSRLKSTTGVVKAIQQPYNNHTSVIPAEARIQTGYGLSRALRALAMTVGVCRLATTHPDNSSHVIPAKARIQSEYGLPRRLRAVAMACCKLSWQLVGNTPRHFHQLLLHGWYLGSCTTFLARQVVACSKLAAQVEKWFFGGLIKGFTTGYVAMAHMAHWVDPRLIAGIGTGVAMLSQQGSKLYLHLQSGRTQLYILWTCIGMGVLAVVWMALS